MRAVAVVVGRGVIPVHVVPAARGELSREVGVVSLRAAVDDGDRDAGTDGRGERPRLRDVHVGVDRARQQVAGPVGRPQVLAGVVEPPEVGPLAVGSGDRGGLHLAVASDVADVRIGAQLAHGAGDLGGGGPT